MTNPIITEISTSPDRITVTDSVRVHATLTVAGSPANGQVETAYDPAGPTPAFVLRGGGATLALVLPPVGSTAPVGHLTHAGTTWDVTWSLLDDPAPATTRRLTVTVADPAFIATTATFTLELAGAGGSALPLVDISGPSMTVGTVEADPTVQLISANVQTVEELQGGIGLQAWAIRTTTIPPAGPCDGLALSWAQVPGGPSAPPSMLAQQPDTLPVIGDVCRRDATLAAPATNTAVTLTFRFTAVAGAFTNSIDAAVEVSPRARRSIIVLDRSGSMMGTRWSNAVRAAHVWLDVVAGIRRGVNPNDRVGILVFDDLAYGFRTGSASDRIQVVEPAGGSLGPLPDPPPATLTINPPGACTPIGDALRIGLDKLLEGLTPSAAPGVFYSLLLLTDGYENSGTIRVDADSPPKGIGVLFDTIKRQGTRAAFNFGEDTTTPRNIRVYPVGVGPGAVQEDVLDNLAYGNINPPNAFYRLTSSIADLSQGFAEIGAHDYGGAALEPSATPNAAFGPDPGVTDAAYVVVPSGEHKLVVVMLKDGAGEAMELTKRVAGGAFEAVPAAALAVWTRAGHDTAVVDLTQGTLNAASTEWRVRRTSPTAALTPEDVIAVRDLAFLADITFDRSAYRTGEPMVITARLRHHGRPVTGATIRVELAMPGESLGTTLAKGSALLPGGGQSHVAMLGPITKRPDRDVDDANRDAGDGGADPLHAKAAMLRAILAARGLGELPVATPPSVFADGTDRLYDDGAHVDGSAADGDYANRFVRTSLEGTYTFRFTINGALPDGSPFADTITMSRWVGIQVDPSASPIVVRQLALADRSRRAIEVFVTPTSRAGELLGPFRASAIAFRTSAGAFTGPLITHPDGRYSRTLEYAGAAPIVTITIHGRDLPPVALGRGCLAAPLEVLRRILRRLAQLIPH